MKQLTSEQQQQKDYLESRGYTVISIEVPTISLVTTSTKLKINKTVFHTYWIAYKGEFDTLYYKDHLLYNVYKKEVDNEQ